MVYGNGDVYSGFWISGEKSGKGTYEYTNGDAYSGDWKADQKHGNGVFEMENGDRYEGEWRGGRDDVLDRWHRVVGGGLGFEKRLFRWFQKSKNRECRQKREIQSGDSYREEIQLLYAYERGLVRLDRLFSHQG